MIPPFITLEPSVKTESAVSAQPVHLCGVALASSSSFPYTAQLLRDRFKPVPSTVHSRLKPSCPQSKVTAFTLRTHNQATPLTFQTVTFPQGSCFLDLKVRPTKASSFVGENVGRIISRTGWRANPLLLSHVYLAVPLQASGGALLPSPEGGGAEPRIDLINSAQGPGQVTGYASS